MMADSSLSYSPSLIIPHSFASNSLTMSPQHQFRTNSARLPRRASGDQLVNLTLQRTHSAESLQQQSQDEQSRLMKPRLDPEELRSHMTDIVE